MAKNLRMSTLLLILGGISAVASAQCRVLVIGDSWAQAVVNYHALETVLARHDQKDITIRGDKTAIGGTAAAFWAEPNNLALIGSELAAEPSIDCVHLSLGGIDFLLGWKAAMSEEETAKFFAQIEQDIATVVAYCLAQRPNIHVVLCGYDYLNLYDTLYHKESLPIWLLWTKLGCPSPTELNGALLQLEHGKAALAERIERLTHVDNLGLMQYHFGQTDHASLRKKAFAPPGDPNLPSPVPALGADGKDGIHLNRQGYLLLAERCYELFYADRLKQNNEPNLPPRTKPAQGHKTG